jgi:hypothetical protein
MDCYSLYYWTFTVWIYNVGVLIIIITIPFLIVTLFVLCFFVTCLVTIGHRCYLHPYLNYDQFHIQSVYGRRWI